MNWEVENVDALMNVWFGGSETADAICDVIFGDVAPSGHLTMTIPQSVGQIPVYYNHLNTGRPVDEGSTQYIKYASNYIDVRNEPLFPFGFGLTYTSFAYSDIKVTTTPNSPTLLTVSATVKNTGSRSGTDVAQFYIHDMAASIARPVKELKGFERLTLAPGESREVSFPVSRELLSFYDAEGNMVFEPGEFTFMIGSNSRDVLSLQTTVE